MPDFQLVSDYQPKGDQPAAIDQLVQSLRSGTKHQTLLGVTGSGKTFTMAHVIARLNRPALVISHNKTLAAQLYSEFREFFPHNAVGYFVSYYDYYQPEAYIPQRDIYIEKETSINDDIDRLRLHATSSLMTRRDVIIVASVSCIYGLGSPETYKLMYLHLKLGDTVDRTDILRRLVDIQYRRSDTDFARGDIRVRGDVIEIYPTYDQVACRIELFGEEIEKLSRVNPLTGDTIEELDEMSVFPAKHFVMPDSRIEPGVLRIEEQLEEQLSALRGRGKLLEAQRLEARTRYDIEMLREVGYCAGMENYSQPLSNRPRGSRPYTLIDYFPDDFLAIVDESHVTVPQVRGMHGNDRTRKTTLVEHGFRLPSALDNRPMSFQEWEDSLGQVIFVSATPADYELEKCEGVVVEQVIRPTGLVDPVIHVLPARRQVNDLLDRVRERVERGERTLVTTLTKRMAEDLSTYMAEQGVRVSYLHSEIDTLERVEVLRRLRVGDFDVLVGVNLLREGLDLPEVSLVCILDADKEGFLRSATSLIQTIGRTARNVNAEVILYADRVTDSMRQAIDETDRRRRIQQQHNEEHNIRPETIRKAIRVGLEAESSGRDLAREMVGEDEATYVTQEALRELEEEMRAAADRLEFETAAQIRDRIIALKGEGPNAPRVWEPNKTRRGSRRKRRK